MNNIAFLIQIPKVIFSALVYWGAIHVLSFIGVFWALSAPLIWFFYPKATLCLFCKTRKVGENCYACRRTIDTDRNYWPKNFRSVVMNSIMILFLSLASLSLVLLETKLLERSGYPTPEKTASLSIPENKTYRIGETFQMDLEISGINYPINTVRTDIEFDPTKLQVIDVSTEESFATIIVQKEIDNTAGYIRLAGGLPSPGFSGESGKFAVIQFKALRAGIATVKVLPSSIALADNGRGDNILETRATFGYLILPERIETDTSGDQEETREKSARAGEATESKKMVFYDSGEEVLGETIDKWEEQSEVYNKVSRSQSVLNFMGKLDNFIVRSWSSLIR
jgi:hypothetical protein